jgi:UDP-glucose/iron transport system permease protein
MMSAMGTGGLGAVALALGVLLMVFLAADAAGGLRLRSDAVVAVVRAVVQMIAVGAVIKLVFSTPALAPVYLAVMLGAASLTSARRLRPLERAWPVALAAIASGAALSVLTTIACHAVPVDARHVVPLSAQLIGGAMTATTLTGQRFLDQVGSSWDEVEGWLAIGATATEAVRSHGRLAARRALVPALDQTRNVGLVVLPGAFVGLLLAGASPVEAGRVQLLVLVGLLAAETAAAVTVTRLLSPSLGTRKPPARD